jgi:hypothetical protein
VRGGHVGGVGLRHKVQPLWLGDVLLFTTPTYTIYQQSIASPPVCRLATANRNVGPWSEGSCCRYPRWAIQPTGSVQLHKISISYHISPDWSGDVESPPLWLNFYYKSPLHFKFVPPQPSFSYPRPELNLEPHVLDPPRLKRMYLALHSVIIDG